MNAEQRRLEDARTGKLPWKAWGPYLSERQWGTVREDYSEGGNAWDYFPHDQARSRAYRWGEDGLAGFADDMQRLCFALALWNGRDPILKERLFGLTNSEGNHGEDFKECYFYLDSTPTHSYMKYLYKYPHAAYPYDDLVATKRRRGQHEPEYELLDTGVFDHDRYFDVFVEDLIAKDPEITARLRRFLEARPELRSFIQDPVAPGQSGRGPIWMPVNGLIVRALLQYYVYYGNDFTIECPTGSGKYMNLYQVAEELTRRLTSIFRRDGAGRRPVHGGAREFQNDPHWRDLILFYEYFHGDNGAGVGASHQTGWTGIIARAMHLFATTTPEQMLELGKNAAFVETEEARAATPRAR